MLMSSFQRRRAAQRCDVASVGVGQGEVVRTGFARPETETDGPGHPPLDRRSGGFHFLPLEALERVKAVPAKPAVPAVPAVLPFKAIKLLQRFDLMNTSFQKWLTCRVDLV